MLKTFTAAARPTIARAGLRATATRSAHALSTPTLMKLEERWETMSEEEQKDIMSQLAERQKGSWKDLTADEKKAAWFISYGPWGPRRPVHGPGAAKKITLGVFGIVSAAAALFGVTRLMAPDHPVSMSKEWQEATNEQLKDQKANPFSGYDQVQSPSRGLPEEDDDDDDE